MRSDRSQPDKRLLPLATAVAVLGWAALALAQPLEDPVDGLRQALITSLLSPEQRDRDLKEQIGGLHGIRALERALALREWRDQDAAEQIAGVDQSNRAFVAQRLERALREVLRQEDTGSRLAALSLIAEMGPTVRGVRSRMSFARCFTPDLIDLTRQRDAAVRAAAARTLGQVCPDPDVAVAALDPLLGAGSTAEKLAAADALVSLLRTACQLGLATEDPSGVAVTRQELVKVGCAVIPLAGRGLGDAEPAVRRRSLEAIGQAAEVLGRQFLVRPMPDEPGLPPTAAGAEPVDVLPLMVALKVQAPSLTRALGDGDGEVRLLARRALEAITNPQLRLLQAGAGVPREGEGPGLGPSRRPPFVSDAAIQSASRQSLEAMALALGQGLTDPDVQARRAAVDVLETLGPAAVAAAPALVAALADKDRFVRWAAARTLGKLGPVEAKAAVPVLARLLNDSDSDLCQAVAVALERYGQAAREAVPELIRAAGAPDAELRAAAVRALSAIDGPGVHALPAVTAALADSSARVRLAAAEGLGHCGGAARRQAAEALRKALQDSDAEVRRAAGEALLTLMEPREK